MRQNNIKLISVYKIYIFNRSQFFFLVTKKKEKFQSCNILRINNIMMVRLWERDTWWHTINQLLKLQKEVRKVDEHATWISYTEKWWRRNKKHINSVTTIHFDFDPSPNLTLFQFIFAPTLPNENGGIHFQFPPQFRIIQVYTYTSP